ncbi:MAG: hypothetical protein HY774_06990 [Acidobacteria bacterium]|nr:hypothetical protein [Acidobacteriota bacterium]
MWYRLQKIFSGIVLTGGISLIWYGLLSIPIKAQQLERLITQKTFKKEPVVISTVSVAGKPVKLFSSFNAENDWLKGLTLHVLNVSPKPIKGVSYVLLVPMKGQQRPLGVILFEGEIPDIQLAGAPQKRVLPFGMISLILDAETYDDLKGSVPSKELLSNATDVYLVLQHVTFTDGSYWSGGRYFSSDHKPIEDETNSVPKEEFAPKFRMTQPFSF